MGFWDSFNNEIDKLAKGGKIIYRIGNKKAIVRCEGNKLKGPQLATNDDRSDGVDNVNVKQYV